MEDEKQEYLEAMEDVEKKQINGQYHKTNGEIEKKRCRF